MKTAPRMAKTFPVFGKLYSKAELAAMTTRQRNQYELSLKHYWEMLSDKETMRNRMKRERAEGRAEERINNARLMIAAGVPEALVLSTLGLAKEDL